MTPLNSMSFSSSGDGKDKWREREKRNNLEEYRVKELNRVQSYKSHQNQSLFRQKHHEATCHWCEGKKILQGTPTNISPAKMS